MPDLKKTAATAKSSMAEIHAVLARTRWQLAELERQAQKEKDGSLAREAQACVRLVASVMGAFERARRFRLEPSNPLLMIPSHVDAMKAAQQIAESIGYGRDKMKIAEIAASIREARDKR